jgi:hypothetical protein
MKKTDVTLLPLDKWIAVCGKIAEAVVERNALIKANVNFINKVLPNVTLVDTPERESGTQTVTDKATPPSPYETPVSST